jgi:hypothetical protein
MAPNPAGSSTGFPDRAAVIDRGLALFGVPPCIDYEMIAPVYGRHDPGSPIPEG